MAFTMEFGTGFEMGQIPVRGGRIFPLRSGTVAASIESTTKHTGSYGIKIAHAGVGGNFYYVRETPSTEIYLSAWVYIEPSGGYFGRINISVGGTVLGYLKMEGGYWNAYINDVKVANGTVGVSASTWIHVQIHYLAADAGVFESIIDGVPDIAYSGDTKPAALDQIDRVEVSCDNWYATIYLDDFALGTGGWPGDIRFDAVLVDSDESAAWSRSAGSDNYALVDERPPSSADYVYTTTDASDRYGTPGTWDDEDDLGNVVKDPVAVIVWADARKQDGNTDDQLQLTQGDGVSEADGGYESLLTSYENRWFIRHTAPDGGEWTKAKVNALVVGIDADME